MSELLRLLVSLSLSGGALTALVALLNRLLRGRMPMGFLYALWLLVLLRFLCPLGTSGSLAHRAVASAETVAVLVQSEGTDALVSDGSTVEPEASAGPETRTPDGIVPLVLAVWAVGAALTAGVRWGCYARFKRQIRAEETPAADWETELLYSLTGGRRPELKHSAAVYAPVLTGIFRPTIYLPARAMQSEELGCALRHELVHWKRLDLPVKWLAVGVACLHWFNPMAWYLVRALERDGELSCDEAAVRGLSRRERIVYGELLLRCAAWGQGRGTGLSAGLRTQRDDMKARLLIIMRSLPDMKKARRLLVGAVVLVAAASVTLGAYSLNSEPAQSRAQLPQPPDTEQTHLPDPQSADTPDSGETDAPVQLQLPFQAEGEVVLSALFGSRVHPITGQVTTHDGIDIVLDQGTPVLAAAAGQVSESDFDSTLGYYVAVDHGGVTTLYAHLNSDGLPDAGAQVEAGEQIGTVGRTGSATGCCLHFQVEADGQLVDPLDCFPGLELVSGPQR